MRFDRTGANIGDLTSREQRRIIELYNREDRCAGSNVEFGTVLWYHSQVNDLSPLDVDTLIFSNAKDSVELYDEQTRIQVIESLLPTSNSAYFGDFHAHTYGALWTSQFPSVADVSSVSVFNDLWEIDSTFIDVAPQVQIIQSLLFGDLFVLTRSAGRPRFTSIEQQSEALDELAVQYTATIGQLDNDFDFAPIDPEPGDWEEVVRYALPRLQATLAGRVELTFISNPDRPG